MAEVEVELVGVDRFAGSAAGADLDPAGLAPVHHAAGVLVLGAAAIPVRTGALAASAVVETDAAGVRVVVGGPRAPYAPYVAAANPFLTDALTVRESAAVDLYIGHVADVVDTIQGA